MIQDNGRTRASILGSVSDVSIRECVEEKLDTMVTDEAGLKRPIMISIVIPTKIDVGRKTKRKELETLGRLLKECSGLADLGYVDEIIVIDASVDKNSKPDYSVLTKVIRTAYLHLSLFRREVGLIASSRAESLHASRGFFDFFVKVVHQFDPNISKLAISYKILDIVGLEDVPQGKGTALWLSAPLVKGDIICFLDSDIMNFRKEMLVALCHPLIRSTADTHSKLKMVKAFYRRLTLRYESPRKEYVFGGRTTRLFAIPLMKILARNYPEIFLGLDTIRYPLSGESAIVREALERLEFPYDYSVEIALLHQVIRRYGLQAVGQVDLDLFYHIGQSIKGLQNMVEQITRYCLSLLDAKGIHLSEEEIDNLVEQYRREANALTSEYRKIFGRLKRTARKEIREPVLYAGVSDRARLDLFASTIADTARGLTPSANRLPAWSKAIDKIDYLALSTMLKRRANQSTYSRLLAAELIAKV
jgi:hypothetical protein